VPPKLWGPVIDTPPLIDTFGGLGRTWGVSNRGMTVYEDKGRED